MTEARRVRTTDQLVREDALDVLSEVGTVRRFAVGEEVFRLGDTGSDMFFVLCGEVEVWED